MSDLYAFDNESDFRRVGKAVKVVEKINTGGGQGRTHVKQDATYAKITELITADDDDNTGKQAKGVEVYFDGATFDYIQISTNPIIYDDDESLKPDADVFATTNITGKTAMAVGDVVKISHYPNLSETSDWLVEETGAGQSTFALCTITAEKSSSEFNVTVKLGNPNATSPDELPTGILFLNYATTNAIAIGGQIMAIVYPSETEGVKFDCFPIETLYNLVAAPEDDEE